MKMKTWLPLAGTFAFLIACGSHGGSLDASDGGRDVPLRASDGAAPDSGDAAATGDAAAAGGRAGAGGRAVDAGAATGGIVAGQSGSGGAAGRGGSAGGAGGTAPRGDDGCSAASAAFGLTATDDFYTVNTGAGLIFSVRRTEPTNNTQSLGDIASLNYNGVEYQDQTRGTQVGTGIGGGTVTATTYGSKYIKIAVTAPDGELTHYYIAKNGCSNIFMGTHFESEPSIGNVRFITRIPYSLLPNGPSASDVSGNTGAIEAKDVYGLANGQTRSKHYSNHRQMDWIWTGATGKNVSVWMVKGNEEGMSGGPFYRSLINQASADADQEIYELINYGQVQTEAYRTNILNLYTLLFIRGTAPAAPDLSFLSELDLVGYVPATGRGGVAGTVTTGRDSKFAYVVGFANAAAQYWATVSSDGRFARTDMLPGTYTVTVYKGELSVWTGSVTVKAGATQSVGAIAITGDPSTKTVIWRIGDWDGTPTEFLNGALLTTMHPQDSRMASWGPVTYTVGQDSAARFPAVQFRGANSPTTVKFTATAAQAASAHTLRIGITVAYNRGRPQVTINDHVLSNPAASDQPNTRSLTVGTYRGNNTTFSWSIPASYFVVGDNTMSMTPISGSSDLGTWLSASYAYDCVELE
jgi:rhamnogalacturonan endolyase